MRDPVRMTQAELVAEVRRLRARLAEGERAVGAAPVVPGISDSIAALLDQLSDALVVTDAGQQVRFWNRAAERFYGWSRAEALGRPIAALVPVVRYLDGTTASQALAQLQQAGVWRGEVVQRHRDGHELVVDASVQQIRGPDGTPPSYLAVNRDISERLHLERERAALRQAAEVATAATLRQAERLRLLAEASQLFATARLDLEATLQTVLSRVVDLVGDMALITLRTEEDVLAVVLEMGATLPPEQLPRHLAQASQAIGELLERVRALSLDLRPALLDDFGLVAALSWLVERVTSQHQLRIAWSYNGIERRFPPLVETTIYRLVQEALTNVLRHAGPAEVRVQVLADQTRIVVQVADAGRGFEPSHLLATPGGSGLMGMRERVQLCGGTLTIDSAPGSGTQLFAEIPLDGELSPEGGVGDGDHRARG